MLCDNPATTVEDQMQMLVGCGLQGYDTLRPFDTSCVSRISAFGVENTESPLQTFTALDPCDLAVAASPESAQT